MRSSPHDTRFGFIALSAAPLWSATLMLAGIGCAGAGGSDPGVSHPTPSNVLPDAAITARISMSTTRPAPLQSLVEQLQHVTPVRTFDGAGTRFRVDDVWVMHDGRPLLLDTASRIVRALRDDNTVTEVASVTGKGPQQMPTRLDGDVHGRLLIAGGDALWIYTPSAHGSGYRYERTITSGAPIEDICSVADEIYVRSSGKAAVLSRYSPSGEHRGAFGTGYGAEDLETARFMSKGRIACVGTPPVIVSAATWLPVVHGYGADGQVRWIARFEDYKPPRLVEDKHRGHTRMLHAQTDFADRLWRVVGIEPHYVVVQVRRFSPTAARARIAFSPTCWIPRRARALMSVMHCLSCMPVEARIWSALSGRPFIASWSTDWRPGWVHRSGRQQGRCASLRVPRH